MQRGDFDAAWAISDQVLRGRDPGRRDDPYLPYHERWVWGGRSFDDADVLVRCYHGLGDTLQFARYLPALRARSRSLTVELQPELMTLFGGQPGFGHLVPFDPARPLPPAPCDLEIMELAHALRIDPRAARPPYIVVPPELLHRTAARLAGVPRPILGLCWRSGAWNALRSLDLPPLLASVRAAGGSLVNFQADATEAERAAARFAGDGACPPQIADTAALIASVDLVVSVDTMVAHLAGALGRPTFLLLSRDADWRWPAGGASCLWYPATTLHRQIEAGDWTHPLRELAGALSARVSQAAAG